MLTELSERSFENVNKKDGFRQAVPNGPNGLNISKTRFSVVLYYLLEFQQNRYFVLSDSKILEILSPEVSHSFCANQFRKNITTPP